MTFYPYLKSNKTHQSNHIGKGHLLLRVWAAHPFACRSNQLFKGPAATYTACKIPPLSMPAIFASSPASRSILPIISDELMRSSEVANPQKVLSTKIHIKNSIKYQSHAQIHKTAQTIHSIKNRHSSQSPTQSQSQS